MSVRRTSLESWVGMAVIAWAGVVAASVGEEAEPAGGRVPSRAEGRSSEVATNLVRSGIKMNSLMRLEEDLSRSLGRFKPGPTMEEDTLRPQARAKPNPAIPNKRAREQAERRKNWVFMNPEDPAAGLTMEEIFNIPSYGADGQEVKHLSPLERFYQSLERRYSNKAGLKPPAENDLFGPRKATEARNEGDVPEDANLPAGIKDMEQNLRKLLGTDTVDLAPGPTHGTMSDIFGLGDQSRSPAEELAHKAYLKEYQRLLEPPSASMVTGVAVAPGTAIASPGGANYSSGLGVSSGSVQPTVPALRPALANPALTIGNPQDVNTKVLNQWNSLYVPPKVEPPKTMAPPSPPEPPRRKF